MSERRGEVLDAALELFQERGPHGVTHRAVDAAARLPQGSTSNLFRTRRALFEALAQELAARRLADAAGPHDEAQTLAWMELLIQARRDPVLAEAIAPARQRMLSLLAASRSDGLPLTTRELAALLTGIEFAEAVTGAPLSRVWDLLDGAGTTPVEAEDEFDQDARATR